MVNNYLVDDWIHVLVLFKNYKKDVRPINFAVAQYKSNDRDYCSNAYEHYYNQIRDWDFTPEEIIEYLVAEVFKKVQGLDSRRVLFFS